MSATAKSRVVTATLGWFASTAPVPPAAAAAAAALFADPPRARADAIADASRTGAQWVATAVRSDQDSLPGRPRPAGGHHLVEAVAVGAEVAVRVGCSLEGHLLHWDPACPAILVGTAAALSRRDGLNEEATARAIGIAATQAGGLAVAAGTPLGEFQRRRAITNAAQAVVLAAAGMTAPAAPLEGRRGLYAVMAPAADPATVLDGLGERWLITTLADPAGVAM